MKKSACLIVVQCGLVASSLALPCASVAQGVNVAEQGRDVTGIQQRVDSLAAVFERHQIAEDFFASALDEQANRFALILTGLLGIGALITFAGFRQEVRRVETDIKAALSQHEELSASMERRESGMEIFTRRTAGNTYAAFAGHYLSQRQPWMAVVPHLLAAGHFYAYYSLSPKERDSAAPSVNDRHAGRSNLKLTLRSLNSIPAEKRTLAAQRLQQDRQRIEEALGLLRQYGDEHADDLLADIRVSLRPLLNSAGKADESASSKTGPA